MQRSLVVKILLLLVMASFVISVGVACNDNIDNVDEKPYEITYGPKLEIDSNTLGTYMGEQRYYVKVGIRNISQNTLKMYICCKYGGAEGVLKSDEKTIPANSSDRSYEFFIYVPLYNPDFVNDLEIHCEQIKEGEEGYVEYVTEFVLSYATDYGIILVGGAVASDIYTYKVKKGENGPIISVKPITGYRFVRWSDGVLTNERQEKNVQDSMGLFAQCEKITDSSEQDDNDSDENSSTENNSSSTNGENNSQQTTTFNLSYSVNNDDYGYITGNKTQTVDKGENGASVTAVAKDGYKFTGWSDGVATATRQDKNVTSTISVKANFEQIKLYKFTLYDDGVISSLDIQENSIVTLDNLTKRGYTFNGWSIDGQLKQAGEKISVSKDITAYARWTIDTYEIVYNLGDGTLENKKISFTIYDLPYALTDPMPQGELGFVKWTTDEAGQNPIQYITELKNYEVYAHYENSAEFLTYKYNEELQGYEVSGYTGRAHILRIPSTYKGIEVKAIGCRAFEDDYFYKVIIPNTVTYIGELAFYMCELAEIVIPNSVTYIGSAAFSYCRKLKEVVIPDGVTDISVSMFSNCESLTKIIIPNNVIRIGNHAFFYCKSLKEIVISDGVTSIDGEAFGNCTSLTKIVIPNSVEDVEGSAFTGCTNLKTMIINSEKVANGSELGELYQYATDVYIRSDITVTASIYNVLFDNLGVEEIDEVEYYHYHIKE